MKCDGGGPAMTRKQWDRLWASIPGKRRPPNDDWYFKRAAGVNGLDGVQDK